MAWKDEIGRRLQDVRYGTVRYVVMTMSDHAATIINDRDLRLTYDSHTLPTVRLPISITFLSDRIKKIPDDTLF